MLSTTPNDGYSLFHQAIMGRDANAWDALLTRYRPLLCAWARRCPSFDARQVWCEDIADEAFTRAWLALTPERFQSFTGLPALMSYLRACVTSAVIDEVRRQQHFSGLHDQLAATAATPPEEQPGARLERAELWDLVGRLAKTDAERLVLYERFALALPPRKIQARHPDLFPDVGQVYSTQRNLCDRLRRHPALAQFMPD